MEGSFRLKNDCGAGFDFVLTFGQKEGRWEAIWVEIVNFGFYKDLVRLFFPKSFQNKDFLGEQLEVLSQSKEDIVNFDSVHSGVNPFIFICRKTDALLLILSSILPKSIAITFGDRMIVVL